MDYKKKLYTSNENVWTGRVAMSTAEHQREMDLNYNNGCGYK